LSGFTDLSPCPPFSSFSSAFHILIPPCILPPPLTGAHPRTERRFSFLRVAQEPLYIAPGVLREPFPPPRPNIPAPPLNFPSSQLRPGTLSPFRQFWPFPHPPVACRTRSFCFDSLRIGWTALALCRPPCKALSLVFRRCPSPYISPLVRDHSHPFPNSDRQVQHRAENSPWEPPE